MRDLFGFIHCTKGSETKCRNAKHKQCSCSCGGKNHGVDVDKNNLENVMSKNLMTRKEFYKNKIRLKSREIDFGVWWRDGKIHPTYRLTYIVKTGELYIFNQIDNSFKILAVIPLKYDIEKILKNWAKVCGDIHSLSWVRKQIVQYQK
jgi:hypothetical protein